MTCVKKVDSDSELQHCLYIRLKVFVEGQGVPLEEEVDGKDAESSHYLLFCDEQPVGTARVRFTDEYAKIERVAVLDECQGRGLGRDIMQFVLDDLRDTTRVRKIKLSSQTYAIPFYEKLNFTVCSDEYMDAGIPHKDMQLMA